MNRRDFLKGLAVAPVVGVAAIAPGLLRDAELPERGEKGSIVVQKGGDMRLHGNTLKNVDLIVEGGGRIEITDTMFESSDIEHRQALTTRPNRR